MSNAWHDWPSYKSGNGDNTPSGGRGHLFGGHAQGVNFALLAHVSNDTGAAEIGQTEAARLAQNLAAFLIEHGAPVEFLDALAAHLAHRCRDCGGRGYFGDPLTTGKDCTACHGTGEATPQEGARIVAHLDNGAILERMYHVGTPARMLNNILKIAPEYGGNVTRAEIEFGAKDDGARRTLTPAYGTHQI